MVALAVRLVPLFFRAYDQAVAAPLNAQAGSLAVRTWTAVLWVGLAGALVLAVFSVVRKAPVVWPVRVFVVTTVLAVATLPLTTSAAYPPTIRPWQLSLPITAAATTVLLSRSDRWCFAGLAAVVIPMMTVEVNAGWDAPYSVLIGDGLFALALFAAWFATTRAFTAAHASLERARTEATREFTRAREAEAHTRAAAVRDAFLHDEVIATLALIGSGGEREMVIDAARELAHRFEASRGLQAPQPTLTAALLHACMTRCPHAETSWQVAPDAMPVPDEVVSALVDATSEALRNVTRHAYPEGKLGPVDVELLHDRDHVEVTIADQGRGFDPLLVPELSLGLALAIYGRMTAVDGVATVDTAALDGTRVTLRWPAA